MTTTEEDEQRLKKIRGDITSLSKKRNEIIHARWVRGGRGSSAVTSVRRYAVSNRDLRQLRLHEIEHRARDLLETSLRGTGVYEPINPRGILSLLAGFSAAIDVSRKEAIMFRALVSSGLLIFASVAAAETQVDYNHNKDFHQYKTFNIQVDAPIDVNGKTDERNTLAMDRLRQAVTRQMEARGLEPVNVGGDLTIMVSSREDKESTLVSSGFGYQYGYGGYGYWRTGWWPGDYWGGAHDVWSYEWVEGTVTIDVIENRTGDLVYRARHMDDVDKNLDKEVDKAVRHAFRRYPIEPRDSD